MNEETNQPFEVVGDPPLEARVVAWVLGEASAFEAEELARLCKETPELEVFRRRIEAVHGLAGEAFHLPAADWKLPEEKRGKVLTTVGEAEIQQRRERTSRWAARRAVWMLAACLVLTAIVAVLALPLFLHAKKSAGKSDSPAVAAQMWEGRMAAEVAGDEEVNLRRPPYDSASPGGTVAKRLSSQSNTATFALPEAEVADRNEDSAGKVPLQTDLPPELIEGTPQPIRLPGLVDQSASLPAATPAPAAPPPPPTSVIRGETAISAGVLRLETTVSPGSRPLAGAEAKDRADTRPAPPPAAEPAASATFKYSLAGPGASGGGSGGGGGNGRGVGHGTGTAGAPATRAPANSSSAKDNWDYDGDYAKRADASDDSLDLYAGKGNDSSRRAGRLGNAPVGDERRRPDVGLGLAYDDPSKQRLADGKSPAKEEAPEAKQPLTKESGPKVDAPASAKTRGMAFFSEHEPPAASDEVGSDKNAAAMAKSGSGTMTLNGGNAKIVQDSNGLEIDREMSGAWVDYGAPIEAAQPASGEPSFPVTPATPAAWADAAATPADPAAAAPAKPATGPAPMIDGIPATGRLFHRDSGGLVEGEQQSAQDASKKPADISTIDRLERVDKKITPPVLEKSEGKLALSAADEDTRGNFGEAEKKAAETGLRSREAAPERASIDRELAENPARPRAVESLREETKEETIKRAIDTHDYAEAVKDFEQSQSALEEIRLKKQGVNLQELREQEKLVEEKRKVLNTIIKSKGVPYRGKLTTQTYPIPSNFAEQLGGEGQAAVPQLLQANGVALPEGSKVLVINGTLSVTAPAAELAKIQGLLGKMKPGPQDVLNLMAEVSAAKDAWSTFSLHVSDASFRVAQAAMARGQRPEKESVRPEEFYNAFDYGDPAPSAGEPVACTVEQAAHPLLPGRNLVRIAVRAGSAGRGAGQPLRLTVLLDNSGSMEREDRRAATREAVARLVSLLGPDDRVTLIGFARQPRLLADQLAGPEAQAKLVDLVMKTPPEGGTNLEQALRLAEELATRQQVAGAQNRVVLLTDGAANLGNANPKVLAARIEGLRQRGIAFDAAGIGADGMNDTLLEALTRDGNGRYYVIDGPQDADASFAKKLAGAFRPAAENVKVQVHFNPARVGRYRLIGFEEHRLKKEDFRNDKVDAAELAAEEAGVALYQVELLPQGEGEIGEVSVRFRDAAAGRMVERSWTIAHDAAAPAFDAAKPSLQLAGLAAMAADVLRDGPLAQLIDHGQMAPVVAKVRTAYGSNARVGEMLRMWEALRR